MAVAQKFKDGIFQSEHFLLGLRAWARNPLPYNHPGQMLEFSPPCEESPDVWKADAGLCSGRYLVNVSLIDKLVVPADTPTGSYVLQLRYDCEETAQVWTLSLPGCIYICVDVVCAPQWPPQIC